MNAPFPIQPELVAIFKAYVPANDNLIQDLVSPRVPVGKKEFKYLKHNLAEGITLPDTKVGRKSVPNQVEFTATEQTASTQDYALDDVIPVDDINNAPEGYDPVGTAVEGITKLIKLDREVRLANKFFDYNMYGSSNKQTLSGTSQFNDYTNSDPYGVISSVLDSMLFTPNSIVMGQSVWSKLKVHPKLIEIYYGKGSQKGQLSREAFAEIFELKNVYIGQALVNTAKKGQTVTPSRAWGKNIVLFYNDPISARTTQQVFSFTAEFGDPVAGSMDDPRSGLRGSKIVRAGESVAEVFPAVDLGYMIKDAVA